MSQNSYFNTEIIMNQDYSCQNAIDTNCHNLSFYQNCHLNVKI